MLEFRVLFSFTIFNIRKSLHKLSMFWKIPVEDILCFSSICEKGWRVQNRKREKTHANWRFIDNKRMTLVLWLKSCILSFKLWKIRLRCSGYCDTNGSLWHRSIQKHIFIVQNVFDGINLYSNHLDKIMISSSTNAAYYGIFYVFFAG